MSIIIDGYNLLMQTGLVPRRIGQGTLHGARAKLLAILAGRLPAQQRSQTIVVFDASDHPPGATRQFLHAGITVRFAVDQDEADDLIEQLIRADSAPRKLVVVSSDRRIQRAARRRKAQPIRSETWYEQLMKREAPAVAPEGARPDPPTPQEAQRWLEEFADAETTGEGSSTSSRHPSGDSGELPERDPIAPFDPFPPGYADDLLE